MAVEFEFGKVRLNGKIAGGIEHEGANIIVWFQSATEHVRFTEDFTSKDLRAIADKLEELEELEQAG